VRPVSCPRPEPTAEKRTYESSKADSVIRQIGVLDVSSDEFEIQFADFGNARNSMEAEETRGVSDADSRATETQRMLWGGAVPKGIPAAVVSLMATKNRLKLLGKNIKKATASAKKSRSIASMQRPRAQPGQAGRPPCGAQTLRRVRTKDPPGAVRRGKTTAHQGPIQDGTRRVGRGLGHR